ncbi:efflux RND transporter periplasmic adaptor subunit [Microbulbifer hainanensis]|uniref:efflux RND transporter periplasmic adaptor subunit n=1 Tax=Microbulbifer hainanensis TaxID=2735675 RepID=UPI0018661658|nr:efflux RND transporter periplasmic adaptor subunit [Microbulbifer hainanensis]
MGGKLVKRLIGIGLFAGLLLFFAYSFMPKPVPVDMAPVTRGPMTVSVSDEGYTRVHDVYIVSAPVTGYLLRIERDVGDRVDAHKTPLAQLLPTHPQFLDERARAQAEAEIASAEAGLNLARAERRDAEAQLKFARADVARGRKLVPKGYISQVELERLELALDSAEAALDTAKAAERVRRGELDNARAQLITPDAEHPEISDNKIIQITAPVSGEVLQRREESEKVVTAGTPLLEIGNPALLEVVVDLLSRDAVQVKPGAPVLMTSWGGDYPLNGRVRLIEPFGFTKFSALGIEEQRVNVIIDFTDPRSEWSRLGHGYRVDAEIETWSGKDILQVPAGALLRHAGQWAVFKVVNGRAVMTPITIGHNNGQTAEVLKGLSEDETLVLHPSERIEDGISLTRRDR